MKSVENDYNFWAASYDTNINKTRDLDKKATKSILSNYHFDSVIELGCGTGKNTVWLATKVKHLIGVDFSEKMLAVAKQKISNNHILYYKSDITKKWTFVNEPVDLITCNLTLEHIESLDVVFKQVKSFLKEDGLFFVSELHPAKQYLGSKARFETEGGEQILETYVHHISDYLDAAKDYDLELVELKEWFDEDENQVPRLISFLFKK